MVISIHLFPLVPSTSPRNPHDGWTPRVALLKIGKLPPQEHLCLNQESNICSHFWEIQSKIYMTTYSHIARSTAPSGVDTEDSFVNVSINCVAVGIRDDWEVANLEEKKRNSFWRVFSEIRTNNAIACFASFDHVHSIHAGAGWTDRDILVVRSSLRFGRWQWPDQLANPYSMQTYVNCDHWSVIT